MRPLHSVALLLSFALVARADEPVPVEWDHALATTCEEAARAFSVIADDCRGETSKGPRLRLLLRGLRYAPLDPQLRAELGQRQDAAGTWDWDPADRAAFARTVSTVPLAWPIEQEERILDTEARFAARMVALSKRADACVEQGLPLAVWRPRQLEASLWAVDLDPGNDELRAGSSAKADVSLLESIRERRSERSATVDRRLRRGAESPVTADSSILELAGVDVAALSMAGLTVEATAGRDAAVEWLRAGARARHALLADEIVRDDELPDDAVRHLVVVESRDDFAAACAVAGWDVEAIEAAVDSLAAVYLRRDVVLIRARDAETAESWVLRYVIRSALPGICADDAGGSERTDWEPWLRTAVVEELVAELATPAPVRFADEPDRASPPVLLDDDLVLRTRLLATAGLLVPFEELSTRRLDELGPRDRLQACAFLRFLRDMHPEQVAPLLRGAARMGYATAVKRVLDRDPAWVDRSFRSWLRLTRALTR